MMFSHKATATNPFTGEVIYKQNYLTKDEITQRIQNSWTSFQMFKKSDPKSRTDKFNRLAEVIDKNLDRLAKTITMEVGKPLSQSKKEVLITTELIRYYASNVSSFVKNEDLKTSAKKSYVLYQPLGPIYQVTPYNFPLFSTMRRAMPALTMGNTVLNRSSDNTPQTGMLIEEMFREAGMSTGEYMNIFASEDQSELIISNPQVRGVSFIGGKEEGTKLASMAGKYSKKIVMQLGGNDPFIVLRDADLDFAADQAVRSRVKHGGQSGISAKRFLIDGTIYEDFKNKIIQRLQTVKIGDPMDERTVLGPLATKESVQRAMDQVKKAQQQGAILVYGGESPKDSNLSKGFFFMPTVLEVTEGNPILKEETFAPIFVLMRISSDQDAIRIANDSPLGLSASIFTRDMGKAEALAIELEVGNVFVNSLWTGNADIPIGGVKESGYGREGGMYGPREFTNIKSVWIA